jgi:hypothetical protein
VTVAIDKRDMPGTRLGVSGKMNSHRLAVGFITERDESIRDGNG